VCACVRVCACVFQPCEPRCCLRRCLGFMVEVFLRAASVSALVCACLHTEDSAFPGGVCPKPVKEA